MKIKFHNRIIRGSEEIIIDQNLADRSPDITIVQDKNGLKFLQNGKTIEKPFLCKVNLEIAAGHRADCTLFWNPKADNDQKLFIRIEGPGPYDTGYKVFSSPQEVGENPWLDPKHRGISNYPLRASSDMIERKANPDAPSFFASRHETQPFLKEFRMPEYFRMVLSKVNDLNPYDKQKARQAYGSLIKAMQKIDNLMAECERHTEKLLIELVAAKKDPRYLSSTAEELQTELKKQQARYNDLRSNYLKMQQYVEIAKDMFKGNKRIHDDLSKRDVSISMKSAHLENLLHEGKPDQYTRAQKRKFSIEEPVSPKRIRP